MEIISSRSGSGVSFLMEPVSITEEIKNSVEKLGKIKLSRSVYTNLSNPSRNVAFSFSSSTRLDSTATILR